MAKPYGGKRRKAMKVLARAKGADLSNVDLAFKPGQRYRHGWIPLFKGASELDPVGAAERKAGLDANESHKPLGRLMSALTSDPVGAANRRAGMDALSRKGKGDKGGAGLSQNEFKQLAQEVRAEKAKTAATRAANPGKTQVQIAEQRYYDVVKKHGRDSKQAKKALTDWHEKFNLERMAKGDKNLSAAGTGIDLSARVVGPRRPRAPRPASFQKAPGTEKTRFSQGALAQRASQPGHYRAKAILAAQQGNMRAAKRFEAKRSVAKALRKATTTPTPRPAMPKAPRPPAAHPAAVVRPAAPRPPATPKPFKPGKPRGPRRVSLSTPSGQTIDLARLTAAERAALPKSAFVFPGKRAYPIHDQHHAAFALAVSKGRPEAATVRAAVRRRYPTLGR